MKYMCIAYEEERKLNDLPVEDWQALRQETLDYVQELRTAGRLILTYPLQSASAAATVRVRSGSVSVTDGPFAEAKEQIGGFFLIDAPDFEEAVRIAAKWPSARIGTIEVRPIDDDLKMDRRYGPPSRS